MADVGSAQIKVQLAEEYLKKQISGLQADLAKIKDVKVNASDGGSFDRLIAGVNEFQQSVASASQYVQGLSATAAQLGQVADSLERGTTAAFDAAVGLNSAQAAIGTLTDKTAEFTGASRQLAEDLKYQSNTTDVLAASYDVLSSGFEDVASVTEVMRAATYAAVGGFTEVSVASDALTSTMNAYGQSTYSAARVADILIQTQNAGKITVAQYGKLIGRVASTAAQAGISLEELSGFVANATVKGVRASSTIDGLRQAIAAVLKPTKMAADEAARLGIKFDENALKTGGLKGILEQLNAVGANSNGTLIKLFGSVEAVAAIVPSAGSNLDSLNKQIQTITNSTGAAEKGFDQVSGSMAGQLTSAANQGKEALTSLGAGAAAVILPLASAAVQLISAFNGLPEPVKASAGAILTVVTGAVAAGAAITGLLAVVPVVTAGWSALAGVMTTSAVVQAASTAATVAQGEAQVALATSTPALVAGMAEATVAATSLAVAETAATASTASLASAMSGTEEPVTAVVDKLAEVGTTVRTATESIASGAVQAGQGLEGMAVSGTTATAATTGLRASLAGLVGQVSAVLAPLALAAAAAYALQGAWTAVTSSFGKGEVAGTVNDAVDALDKIKPSADSASESVGPLAEKFGFVGQAFESMAQSIKDNGGVFGAAAAGLGQLADQLNLPFDVVTAKQVDAQQAMIAFEEVVSRVGDRLDTGRGILEQYGQASGDAGKRSELSKEQVAAFSAKVKEQVDALTATIDALHKVKPADDAHAASLNANIALLTQQKKTLEDRTKALGVDTEKLQENGAATQFLTDKIAGLADAYKSAADASDLASAETKADILDQAVDAGKSAGDVQQAITEAERKGLEDRIKLASEKGNELRKLLEEASGDPAKTKEVQTEIAKIESDIFRDRQALANSVLQERQQAEDKAKQVAEQSAQASKKAADESERASEEAAQAAKKAADEQIEAQRKVAEAAKKALDDMVKAADTAYSLQEGKLKNSLDAQLVAIKEQQAAGKLSKEQAEQAKLKATQDSLKAELVELSKAEETAKALRSKGAISQEELQRRLLDIESKSIQTRGQLADQTLAEQEKVQKAQEESAKQSASQQEKIAKDGSGAETEAAKQRTEADKKLREEQVKAAEDAYAKAAKAAQVGTAEELAAVKAAQARGDLSGDDAAKAEQAIRDKANQAELAQIAKQMAEVAKLKRQGALSADEAEAKLLDLRSERARVSTAISESQIQAQQKAEQQAVQAKEQAEQAKAKAVEEAAKREQEAKAKAEQAKRDELERTQQATDSAISKAKTQADEEAALAYETARAKGESKEQLEARLAKIDQQSLARSRQISQDELSALDDLVNRGVLSEADATKRKEALRQQLAQIRIQQAQAEDKAEEAAHQAQLARIDQRIKLAQQESQQAIQAKQLAADQIGLEKADLGSLVSLTKARNDLEAQRLAYSLKDAKTDQEKLAAQQAINSQKVAALIQEQAFAKQNLELDIQQRDIELQQKELSAQSALVEAQLALEKAKVSGASERELALLNTQVALRQQGLEQVAKSVALNGQVLATRQREELSLKQQADLESTVRQGAEAVQPLLGQPNLDASKLTNAQVYGNSAIPVLPPAISSNPLASSQISQGLPTQALQNLGNSSDNLSKAMNTLAQALGKGGCNPNNLTVVTNDPGSDLAEILRQLAK